MANTFIGLAGNPNCGKTTLFNELTGSNGYVGNWPGVTVEKKQAKWRADKDVTFVDLPGYGFARVSKAEKERWSELIGGYFELERSFNLVLSLVDIRHEAQKLDQQMIGFLQDAGLPYLVVLTKGDKLGRGKQNSQAALLSRQLEVPRDQMIITSAQTGQGIDELKTRIAAACL